MIKSKDIQVREVKFSKEEIKASPHKEGMRLFRASIVLSVECWVDENENQQSKGQLVEMAKERLQKDIWHRLYGSLLSPFFELKQWAFKYCTAGTYQEIEKEFSKFQNLLNDKESK